ncbi:MAG: hypothetical protein UW39_C0005G0030 [Parcubacteria group bacterium GW2011_GWC2_44_17]|uniref:Addiction module toxin, HicA family n=1 Tax=Candidatus Jacksonbacteria bacterium RIFCSPLOWO2_02_FULL_44_20 TaxID=1798460 RepID=A0A1G2AAZ0_9BACT|nr:MAG: hypothetical protein UW39_C0005G0030 [Parcubacteria group bacterium GW2011_GWC2_44_17]KKT49300.1 MAG: hypothetical protein UW40_C0023G0020 [Parcubacteria group bacterium GW2011_GWF2_44_17]OGY71722.1 MAG: hypothetical protein A3E05_03295 [Candidatus Jacksonbacteria bacterium RIFCSPHIGHO2_12_FULL_44_12]OGY71882.1 MAG: hypothetical protein A3C00_01100 [Candidatus Jacksonbacteria bacterium RIFCSPHIGHO2_02_FULL_44_25]OGY73536.1 MAG: hypothetical protein A3H07_03825 [Candidatus Jacksonbacteri
MPKMRLLSGSDIIKILATFSFVVVHQRGSHVKLQRRVLDGTKQTLTIPNHQELDRGTSRAIYNQAARYISETELRPYFFAI